MSPDSLVIFCGINIVVGLALWWPHRRGTALFVFRGFSVRPMAASAVESLLDEIPPKARQILEALAHEGERQVFEERVGPFRVATAFVHAMPTALVVVRRLAGGHWRIECASKVDGVATLAGGDGVAYSEAAMVYHPNATDSIEALVKAHVAPDAATMISVEEYFEARRALLKATAHRVFRRDALMAAIALGIIGVNVYGIWRISDYV